METRSSFFIFIRSLVRFLFAVSILVGAFLLVHFATVSVWSAVLLSGSLFAILFFQHRKENRRIAKD